MSQFDDAVAMYTAENDTLGLGLDAALIAAVAKSLGPSIYNEDSSRVSCSDQEELDRVKKNFLVGKLGLADGADLDAGLAATCEKMGSSNRNKYRALFYALLVVHFGKEAMYA